jgi:hypothetical protein
MVFSIIKTINQLFIGSSQSRTAAIAIIIAIVAISLSIFLNENDLNFGERIGLVCIIILFSLPSILFALIDLTCITTNTTDKSFCWFYGWIISIIIIITCILVIFISLTSMINYNDIIYKNDKKTIDDTHANNIANDLLLDSIEIKEPVNNTEKINDHNQFNLEKQYDNDELNNFNFNNDFQNVDNTIDTFNLQKQYGNDKPLYESFQNNENESFQNDENDSYTTMKKKRDMKKKDPIIEGFMNGGEFSSI